MFDTLEGEDELIESLFGDRSKAENAFIMLQALGRLTSAELDIKPEKNDDDYTLELIDGYNNLSQCERGEILSYLSQNQPAIIEEYVAQTFKDATNPSFVLWELSNSGELTSDGNGQTPDIPASAYEVVDDCWQPQITIGIYNGLDPLYRELVRMHILYFDAGVSAGSM